MRRQTNDLDDKYQINESKQSQESPESPSSRKPSDVRIGSNHRQFIPLQPLEVHQPDRQVSRHDNPHAGQLEDKGIPTFTEENTSASYQAQLVTPGSQLPADALNDVLCQEYMHDFVFMLPAFLRLNCQGLVDTNTKQNTAKVNLIVIFTVWYNQLPEELVEQLERSIRLDIGQGLHLNLIPEQFISEPSMSLKVDNVRPMKQLCYVVRGVFEVDMECDLYDFPFEDLKITISVGVGANKCRFLGKDAYIYFNNRAFIKNEEKLVTLSTSKREDQKKYHKRVDEEFESKVDHLRMFNLSKYRHDSVFELDLASTKCTIEKGSDKVRLPEEESKPYENEKIHTERYLKQLGITPESCQFLDRLRPLRSSNHVSYSKVKFQMRLFRYPLSIFLTIMIPVMFLCFINLAIFLQENNLASRIASIVTVIVAYSTYLPTLRERTPESHGTTMMEIVMYSVIFSGFLSFLRGLIDANKKIKAYNCFADPLFLACLFAYVIIVLGMSWMFIVNGTKMREIKKFRNNMASKKEDKDRYGYRIPLAEMRHWKSPEQLIDKRKNEISSYAKLFKENGLFMRIWLKRFETYIGNNPVEGRLEDINWNLKLNLTPYYRKVFSSLSKYFVPIMNYELKFYEALTRCKQAYAGRYNLQKIGKEILQERRQYFKAVNSFLSEFREYTQIGTLNHQFDIVACEGSPIAQDNIPFLQPCLTYQLVQEIAQRKFSEE